MALNTYKHGHNLGQASESASGARKPTRSKPLIFVVQKHRASRLHYDLRLEMQGVLKSWAVPKVPSMNPHDKRLAMKVEDHPLEYANFEGTIPKGNYGAGTVEIWDRGEFIPAGTDAAEKQLRNGNLKFVLKGERLKGEFALVKIKKKEKEGEPWLLVKHRDVFSSESFREAGEDSKEKRGSNAAAQAGSAPAAAAATEGETARPSPPVNLAELPGARATAWLHSPSPMLATLSLAVPEEKGWLYEIKWDGIRALCFLQKNNVRYKSRNGIDLTAQFPELQQLKRTRAKSAILDGEIVVFDEDGRADFQALQPRIMEAGKTSRPPGSPDATLLLFDVLYCDGYDLRSVPMEERKQVLASIVRETRQIRISTHIVDHGEELLDLARGKGLEGIMAKRSGSLYEASRSANWKKIKLVREQDCVICGYTREKRSTFASLLLGVYEDGQLRYAGNVGTGFDEKQQRIILEALKPHAVTRSPFAEKVTRSSPISWVAPRVVCRVRYTHWTRDRRLRAPVYLGLRPDILPEQCVPEDQALNAAGEG